LYHQKGWERSERFQPFLMILLYCLVSSGYLSQQRTGIACSTSKSYPSNPSSLSYKFSIFNPAFQSDKVEISRESVVSSTISL
jgi:hypothetical protein